MLFILLVLLVNNQIYSTYRHFLSWYLCSIIDVGIYAQTKNIFLHYFHVAVGYFIRAENPEILFYNNVRLFKEINNLLEFGYLFKLYFVTYNIVLPMNTFYGF